MIAVDGELLAGSMPTKQLQIINGWLAVYENEVYAAWNKAVKGDILTKSIHYKEKCSCLK